MRSFLGLSSQFRDHVKDYAKMAKPLHEAITDNKKNSKSLIKWTPTLEAQFNLLQEKVATCPKLLFLDAVFHANMKFFSIEKNLLIYSLNNNNNFTKKQVSYYIFPKITPSNCK